jgi:lipopolysaccharide/colanic/teichoic acid biosynthesis glycosyltransferase
MLELISAILILIITILPAIIISLIIYIETKASPFIIQERGLSLTNSRIKIIKFRTLKKSAIKIKNQNGITRVFFKTDLCHLVPPFCRFIRKRGIDELPQILNVIKGNMSLIGPRPLIIVDLQIIKKYDIDSYYVRDNLNSKPGISGTWQLYGEREFGIKNLIENDNYYEHNKSFVYDGKLILSTISVLIFGKNSDSILDKEFKNIKKPQQTTISHQVINH